MMPPSQDAIPSALPPGVGFVVAMRARIALDRRQLTEWIIVSRWGERGQHLSLGRTFRDIQTDTGSSGAAAPFDLVPVWTALARLVRLPPARHASFLLERNAPAGVAIAGTFAPSEGYVRLYDRAGTLRLFAEGRPAQPHCKPAWRLQAARRPWLGEFIEGRTAPPG